MMKLTGEKAFLLAGIGGAIWWLTQKKEPAKVTANGASGGTGDGVSAGLTGWFHDAMTGLVNDVQQQGASIIGSPVTTNSGAAAVSTVKRVAWQDEMARAATAAERRTIKQRAFNRARNAGLAFESESWSNGVPLPETFGAWAPTEGRPAFAALANYIRNGFRFGGSGINESVYAKTNFLPVFADWATKYGMPLNW